MKDLRTSKLLLKLAPAEKEKLRRLAARSYLNMSQWLRKAIRDGYNPRGPGGIRR